MIRKRSFVLILFFVLIASVFAQNLNTNPQVNDSSKNKQFEYLIISYGKVYFSDPNKANAYSGLATIGANEASILV